MRIGPEGEGQKDKRRFFAVRRDVADSFAEMVSRKNLTMYDAVTNILQEAVQLDLHGDCISDAPSVLRRARTAAEAGYVSVPETLWSDIAESSYNHERESILQKFREAGGWLGRYVLAKSHGTDLLPNLIEGLAPLTSDCTEFNVDGGETLRVECFNPSHSQVYTELFSALLVAAVESLGYSATDKVSSRGAIVLSFSKRQEPLVRAREK